MGDHDLVEIIEGALLAAGEPLSKKQLAQLFDELDFRNRSVAVPIEPSE